MNWRKLACLLLFSIWIYSLNAQERYINISSQHELGNNFRIIATPDQGFVVFSLDSLKLTKFDACGMSEWTKSYQIPDRYVGLQDFIGLQNGGFAMLVRIKDSPDKHSSAVVKLDGFGSLIWAKIYPEPDYSQYPYTLNEDELGNLFFFGNNVHANNSPLYNVVCKLNANGKLLWTRFYNHGGTWGGAIVTSDGGMLLRTGNNFIKTDQQGNDLWTSTVLAPNYVYFTALEIEDGYIFTGKSQNTGEVCLYKLDKSGNLKWNSRRRSNYLGNPPQLRKTKNGTILMHFNVTDSGKNYVSLVEFDKDLNVIKQSFLNSPQSNLQFMSRDLQVPEDGFPILAGLTFPNSNLLVARLNSDLQSSCDTNLPLINFVSDSIGQNFVNTTSFQHAYNEVDFNFIVNSSVSQETSLCHALKELDLGPDTTFCENVSITLGNTSPDNFETYLWSTGEASPSITIQDSGTYWVLATYNCGQNILWDTIHVSLLPVVEADLGEDTVHCDREALVLQAPNCPTCNFQWSTGSNNESISVLDPGLYWLDIYQENGCFSSDSLEIDHLLCEDDFEVPNVFSPNGDGVNDIFRLNDPGILSLNAHIFDRWGQEIFSSRDPDLNWEGKGMNEGIYYFGLDYVHINGKSGTRKGFVTLLR